MKGEQHLKRVVPFNVAIDGVSRTLKAQYYKNGFRNFTYFEQGGFGATGVLEYYWGRDSEDGSGGVLQVRGSDAVDGEFRNAR